MKNIINLRAINNAIPGLFIAVFILTPFVVSAHQSGCHRWHSCPSDTGSYVCGDLGYTSGCPSSSSSYYSSPSYYSAPAVPSCPLMSSYDSISGGCKCYSGYVVDKDILGNQTCVSASLMCSRKIGIMSTYNSLTKQCECMSGYRFNGLSCEYKRTSYSYTSPSYKEENTCPVNSHQSPTNIDSCLCDTGYKVNSKKDACVVLTKNDKNKACKTDFGSKSKWSGKTNEEGNFTCGCNKGYEFNSKGDKCVKED